VALALLFPLSIVSIVEISLGMDRLLFCVVRYLWSPARPDPHSPPSPPFSLISFHRDPSERELLLRIFAPDQSFLYSDSLEFILGSHPSTVSRSLSQNSLVLVRHLAQPAEKLLPLLSPHPDPPFAILDLRHPQHLKERPFTPHERRVQFSGAHCSPILNLGNSHVQGGTLRAPPRNLLVSPDGALPRSSPVLTPLYRYSTFSHHIFQRLFNQVRAQSQEGFSSVLRRSLAIPLFYREEEQLSPFPLAQRGLPPLIPFSSHPLLFSLSETPILTLLDFDHLRPLSLRDWLAFLLVGEILCPDAPHPPAFLPTLLHI